jgi:hypothetical protein
VRDQAALRKRARRLGRRLPRGLRLGLAAWLLVMEARWLIIGAQPLATRTLVGGIVLVGALALLSRRWWRGGAATIAAGLAAAAGWHLAVGGTPWSLVGYTLVLAALVAWDLGAATRLLRLRRRFWDGSLAPADFDHQRHLLLALDSVRRLGPADALAELRSGLQALAARAGRPEGYHETRTQAWLAMVAALSRRHAHEPLPRLCERLVDDLGDAHLLLRHYSQARLDSPEARARFVPPDRAPLPR